MTTANWVGAAMLGGFLAGLFAVCVREVGIKAAVAIWGGAISATAFVWGGAYLFTS